MKPITLPIYDLSGKTTKSMELDPTVFAVEQNITLIHQAVNTFLANRRATTAHTKTRGEISGGGRKPWRQKGTGNARAGSTRSPIWRGGGVTFGPTNARNYSVRMPQKMRQAAYKMAISARIAANGLTLINSLDSLDGKTKSWIKAFDLIPHTANKTLVVSLNRVDLADRSIRNVPNSKYITLEGLTVYDIMRFPQLIMTTDSITALAERFGGSVKEASDKPKTVEAKKA